MFVSRRIGGKSLQGLACQLQSRFCIHSLTDQDLDAHADQVREIGFTVIRGLLDVSWVDRCAEAFEPVLASRMAHAGEDRGAHRYYATPPFVAPFSESSVYAHPAVIGISRRLLGDDFVMCQWALDTPCKGSEYQVVHRDAAPLFPEDDAVRSPLSLDEFHQPDAEIETALQAPEPPPYQLALNFPLVDVIPAPGQPLSCITGSNGPVEVARATHRLSESQGRELIEEYEAYRTISGTAITVPSVVTFSDELEVGGSGVFPEEHPRLRLEPVWLRKGDAIIRDVRGLHRGTPNDTTTPRPMVVVGYSRGWQRRPEVGLRVPESTHVTMPPIGRFLTRFEPIVSNEEGSVYDPALEDKYDADALAKASGESFR